MLHLPFSIFADPELEPEMKALESLVISAARERGLEATRVDWKKDKDAWCLVLIWKQPLEDDFIKRWQREERRVEAFLFCERPYFPSSTEEIQQLGQVMQFRESLDSAIKGAFTEREQLVRDVTPLVNEYLDAVTPGLEGMKDTLNGGGVVINQNVQDARGEVTGIKVIVGEPSEEQRQKDREATRRKYLERLRDLCRHLPLAAIGAMEGDADDITLEDVYIGLNTDRPVDLEEGPKSDGHDQEKETAIEALRKHPRLMLLGDPGSGKSTFVNEVLATYIDVLLGDPNKESPAGLPDGLVPVRIILRDLAASMRTAFPEGLPEGKDNRALARLVRDRALFDLERLEAGAFAPQLRDAFEEQRVLMVLDGLDEVPSRQRVDIRRVVRALVQVYRMDYLVVTCRVRSYADEARAIPECQAFTLAEFDDEQKKAFARAWYRTLAPRLKLVGQDIENKASDLADAATSAELSDLSGNPMILTTIALIHQRNTILPDKRVELYQEAIEVMLHKWQQRKGLDELGVSDELAAVLKNKHLMLEAMMRLAHEAHSEQSADKEFAGIERGKALILLESPEYLGSAALADQFLDYVDQRSGLLQGQGGSDSTGKPATYGFPHRTFQEFLAGRYLAVDALDEHLKHLAEVGDFWYEAVRFGLEDQVYLQNRRRALLKMAYLLRPSRFPRTVSGQRLILWIGYIVELAGSEFVEADQSSDRGGKVFLRKIKDQLVRVLGGKLPPIERAEAGRILGCIGDPRPQVTGVDRMTFCQIPAGSFQMGTNRGEGFSFDDERPRKEVNIPYEYWISTFPVTQGQFASFIEAGGYDVKDYWTEAGWESKNNGMWQTPRVFRKPFMLENHPVVGVSWYEANAFTKWLTMYLAEKNWLPEGWVVALPNEAEWEKAARGGVEVPEKPQPFELPSGPERVRSDTNKEPARIFPWGNEDNANLLNYVNTEIRRTSAPGCFPKGASPYGVQDLVGNVLEWTRDLWSKPYPTDLSDQRQLGDEAGTSSRVLRGGAFHLNQDSCRSSYRLNGYYPNSRVNSIGFRLVLRPAFDLWPSEL